VVLAITGISLTGVSCACNGGRKPFVSAGRTIDFQKILKMAPFAATVESVEFDHPFFKSGTSVSVSLKKPDTCMRLVLDSYPSDPTIIGFAHSLHEGQSYIFPQVYVDYVNSHGTNAPSN